MVDFFFISALSCVLKCNDLNHFKCAARWHQLCPQPVPSSLDSAVRICSGHSTQPGPGHRLRFPCASHSSRAPVSVEPSGLSSSTPRDILRVRRDVAGAGRAASGGRLRAWEWTGRLARPLTHTGHSGSIHRLAAVNCAAGTTGDGSLLSVLLVQTQKWTCRTLAPVCGFLGKRRTAGLSSYTVSPSHRPARRART